jgi:hypothetical protein
MSNNTTTISQYVDKNYKGSYSIVQMQRVRTYLINKLYGEDAKSVEFIELKRKCGILTNDVEHYFKKGQLLKSTQKETVQLIETDLQKEQIEKDRVSGIDISDLLLDPQKRFSLMTHRCERTNEDEFCPLDITLKIIKPKKKEIIYVCDICRCKGDEKFMTDHLDTQFHISASKYLINLKPIEEDATESRPENVPVEEEESKTETHKKRIEIKSLISRCSLKMQLSKDKTKISKNKNSIFVFCPKCFECFDQNVLACAYHFSLFHDKNTMTYSVSKALEVKIS